MKITWLGQAGLLLETKNVKIIIDPYLSNSVEKIQPHFWRRVPVDERFLAIRPDVIVLTHDHLDHTDPDTLKHYLGENTEVCVLASGNAWNKVRREFGGIQNNYVQFNRGTEWTEKGVRFQAVYAEHSDDCAIGVVIHAEGKTYYVTGDTLYHERIFDDLPAHIDCVFLPVNGVGNNMNMEDAKRFCERIGAVAVPMHCGLFDEKDLHDFKYENKVVPEFYKEIKRI
ncbi:MAG: MBL fold metallo-hydrolase [Ruminococcaceae bacterium]|nr:MBL fold metallo-hydrolase [Oscillospiraceae bacterium]